MDKDAFDLHKHSSRGNMLEWIKNLLIVDYAEVIEVIDINTVTVQLLVQNGQINNVYQVRLLHVGSSKLVEDTVQPQLHDQVLLLFLRSHDDLMFLDSEARAALDPGHISTINKVDGTMNRYNMFSGVGILAKTANERAAIVRHTGVDSDGAFINEQIGAKITTAFKMAVSYVFDSPKTDAGVDPPSAPFDVFFGRQVPVSVEHRAPVTLKLDTNSDIGLTSKSGLDAEFHEDVKLASDADLDLEGNTIELIKTGASPAARKDDTIEITIITDPTNLAALTAVCSIFGISFTPPLTGSISSGSGKVKIGG